MTKERIIELQNRPIDFSDIPEITEEQAKEFYPRKIWLGLNRTEVKIESS